MQPGQHWRSCDLTGSLPPQWPRSPAICAQQLIRCRCGCGTSARTGRVTAKIDKATIKTKQRDNAVITSSKLTREMMRINADASNGAIRRLSAKHAKEQQN